MKEGREKYKMKWQSPAVTNSPSSFRDYDHFWCVCECSSDSGTVFFSPSQRCLAGFLSCITCLLLEQIFYPLFISVHHFARSLKFFLRFCRSNISEKYQLI